MYTAYLTQEMLGKLRVKITDKDFLSSLSLKKLYKYLEENENWKLVIPKRQYYQEYYTHNIYVIPVYKNANSFLKIKLIEDALSNLEKIENRSQFEIVNEIWGE